MIYNNFVAALCATSVTEILATGLRLVINTLGCVQTIEKSELQLKTCSCVVLS